MNNTTSSDDRWIGAAAVAGVFGAVGAGAMHVVYGFGFSSTIGLFMLIAAIVFVALAIGWQDDLPPPGSKKAPTAGDSHTTAPAPSAPAAPAASATSAQASPSGAAPAAATAPVEGPGTRPEALAAARDGKADDLKQIKGVGPALEKLCNSLGFYHFDQIAAWTGDEVAWVDQNLEGFKGRVTRDDWVAQAKILAAGGSTEFSQKVDKGDVY